MVYNDMAHYRVRCISKYGATASLIVSGDKLNAGILNVANCFPVSEALKLERMQISHPYDSFVQAFEDSGCIPIMQTIRLNMPIR